MKRIVFRMICLALMFFLLIISCFSCTKDSDIENNESENDEIIIGLVVDGLVIERWQKDRDIFISKAKELGATVIAENANEDTERQRNQINKLANENVDVLVIIPYDKDGLSQCVKAAKKKGIKVIAYDRLIRNADVDAYISFNNEKVGYLMAKTLYDKVPKGNYIIINGSQKDNNSYLFNMGFKKVLSEGIDSGDVVILDEVWSDDWREDMPYETVSKAIDDNKSIDAIIGANDRLAEGAIKALSENRMAGHVFVVGHDANLSACQRIVEGTQLCTVYKPIKLIAEGAAELAVNMAKKKDISYSYTIDDGKNKVPFIRYEPIVVTKETMVDTIIKDGFHTIGEVYRNVPKNLWPKLEEYDEE